MVQHLFTPISNARTRSPNFFNGRLLSAEALTDEQRSQRVAHQFLGGAIGEGVVYGFEVAQKAGTDSLRPSIDVKGGLAINGCGSTVYLPHDVELQLVRPPHALTAPPSLFSTCLPPQEGTYVADDGVYLLTVAPVGVGEGLAEVSGLGDAPRGCNIKYRVDAVEFRLWELPTTPAQRADTAHLRNFIAYRCFGVADLLDFATDPLAGDGEPRTLLDEIRGPNKLSDCDVALAVLHWRATAGIQYLDMWSVRRRAAHGRVASAHPVLSDRRAAASEAMVLQFEEQIGSMTASTGFIARTAFRYLPPVGVIPLAPPGSASGFAHASFFQGKTFRPPMYMEGGAVQALFDAAFAAPPIDLSDAPPAHPTHTEMVWLYCVRENMQRVHAGVQGAQAALVFANGNVPYAATPRFDLSHFSYANFI